MYLCKFGQNPFTGSKDIASERSYADADADGIRTKNNMSPTFGWGDIIDKITWKYDKRSSSGLSLELARMDFNLCMVFNAVLTGVNNTSLLDGLVGSLKIDTGHVF